MEMTLWRDLVAACQYQSRGCEESGARFLAEMHGRSLRDNGHEVKWGKFVLCQEVLVCDDPSKKDTQTL